MPPVGELTFDVWFSAPLSVLKKFNFVKKFWLPLCSQILPCDLFLACLTGLHAHVLQCLYNYIAINE